jgi:hypothetical protein
METGRIYASAERFYRRWWVAIWMASLPWVAWLGQSPIMDSVRLTIGTGAAGGGCWFLVDWFRHRGGQSALSLRRFETLLLPLLAFLVPLMLLPGSVAQYHGGFTTSTVGNFLFSLLGGWAVGVGAVGLVWVTVLRPTGLRLHGLHMVLSLTGSVAALMVVVATFPFWEGLRFRFQTDRINSAAAFMPVPPGLTLGPKRALLTSYRGDCLYFTSEVEPRRVTDFYRGYFRERGWANLNVQPLSNLDDRFFAAFAPHQALQPMLQVTAWPTALRPQADWLGGRYEVEMCAGGGFESLQAALLVRLHGS